MSVEESNGSYSLTSFARQLKLKIPRSPQQKKMGKRNSETVKNLPDDLYEKLKTPPHETQGERKKRVQRITQEWARRWLRYESLDEHHEEMFAVNPPLKVLSVKARPPLGPGVNPHPSTLKTHEDFPDAYQRYLKRFTSMDQAQARRLAKSVEIPRQPPGKPQKKKPGLKKSKPGPNASTSIPQAPFS